jgi:hypothetical protein
MRHEVVAQNRREDQLSRKDRRYPDPEGTDPSDCLMETLARREDQERIRIRRATCPCDYAKCLP